MNKTGFDQISRLQDRNVPFKTRYKNKYENRVKVKKNIQHLKLSLGSSDGRAEDSHPAALGSIPSSAKLKLCSLNISLI